MKFFSTFSQKYLEVIKKAVSLQRFREIEHIKLNEQMKGRLAQLVQSICLTSRGSAVRIRQRPHKIQALSFIKRAFSSAGSEHLPYKQRVGGSNPSTPTFFKSNHDYMIAFFISQPTQRNTLFSHYSLKEG